MARKQIRTNFAVQTKRHEAVFWLCWVACTTVVAGLSYFMAGAVVSLRAQSDKLGQLYGGANFMTGDNALASAILWGFLLVIVVGPSISLAQAIVLRQTLGYKDWKKWAILTALGMAIAFIVATIPIIGVPLAGIAIGAIQWSILRSDLRNAGSWVISTPIALALAVGLGAYIALNFLPSNWVAFPSWPFYPLSAVLYWSCGFLVCTFVFTSITGAVLVLLMRKSPPD